MECTLNSSCIRIWSHSALDRTLATVQATVRSIAVRHDGGKTEEIFMLCDTGDGGNRIRVYDMESGSERVLDGAVPCSEIVLAR